MSSLDNPNPLDNDGNYERQYADAGSDPTQADIEYLCQEWAEVAKSIWARSKQKNESNKEKERTG